MENWFLAEGALDIPTPALLIYPDRINENIRRMIKIAGSADKLRPHVKTHKMSEVVRLQIKHGIKKFKCSTIAEAEMVARSGGKDVLLAMQPVGVQISRYFMLTDHFADVKFSTISDSIAVIQKINDMAKIRNIKVALLLDINNGMNRTGIEPGDRAVKLYKDVSRMKNIHILGLHVYDGHIHEHEYNERRIACETSFQPVNLMIQNIIDTGLPEPHVVAGGTPTFPIHANRRNTELSPGTCLLWDQGYSTNYQDLDFLYAALLLTTVISKPAKNLLCLDLGHKSIAAEMSHPRVKLLNIDIKGFLNHSEEHMVIETPDADRYNPGDQIYAIPWHICPTVPRYPAAYTVENGRITGEWKIDARDRVITI